ncbi:MAG TPA: hypothetical protein VM345_01990 [Acidimicrobiales bacterium]|nr:hypothetical protein [Acidimicrobiales bacterium]
MPGPTPKRSDQRRRANKPEVPIDRVAAAAKVSIPAASKDWHPAAKRWYQSLRRSGQAAFYEESDWATAWVVAESMSRELNPQPIVSKDGDVVMVEQPPKGASLAAWLKAMTALMVTEGDRRRLRLELVRQGAEEASDDVVTELRVVAERLQKSS